MKTFQLFPVFIAALASTYAVADVTFIAPAGITAEAIEGKIIHQRSIPDHDASGKVIQELVQADLELTLRITDQGCALRDDSPISASFTQHYLNETGPFIVKNQIDLFVPTSGNAASASGCIDSSSTVRTETITLPMINGSADSAISNGADVTYRYTLNAQTGYGAKSTHVDVVVNFQNQSTEVKLKP
jgi:hypothetical protein